MRATEAPLAVRPPGLLRRWEERRSPRRVKVATSLRWLHEVFGLEHLHYGLWDGEPLDLGGLRSAQERYAERLADWVPAGVTSILDVGAGVGSLSRRLRDRGFEVEGLSPDPYQAELYARRVERPFHLVRFQEFEPTRAYDLVLMSESAQYVWLDRLFPAVRRAAPGGHLLLSDYMRTTSEKGSGHRLDELRAAAARDGLELTREEDVTEATLPTLELGRRWLDQRVGPTVEILADNLRARHPLLFALGRRLVTRRLAEARRNVDAELFRRTRRYLFQLYRVP